MPAGVRVFLCHSSIDKPAVRALYQRLRTSGMDPWLDDENLLPGQDWRVETSNALRNSDAVLVCLSRESIAATGQLHRDILTALDQAELMPEDRIFVIPCLLDACAVPPRLSRWHAVNLYDDRGFDNLLRSLRQLSRPAEITFTADCVADPKSVEDLTAASVPVVRFHSSITGEIARIDDWWLRFDEKSRIFPWGADNASYRQQSLAQIKADLRDSRDKIHHTLEGASAKLSRVLEVTPEDWRQQAAAQMATILALQLIRLIQLTDGFLPDEGPAVHTSFPTLPRIPRHLVDLVPHRSAIGNLAFHEDQFLLARVGEQESRVQSVVMPRYTAQHIHKSAAIGDAGTFYRWVVPQWIHYEFEDPLPAEDNWRVFVLTDDRGRECYFASSPRPWETA